MTVLFPPLPRGAVVSPRLVRVGGDLVSTLGGPTQRITRVGSRYAAEVQLPSLDADCAAKWLACPLQAEAQGQTLGLTMPQTLDVRLQVGNTGTGVPGSSQVTVAGPVPNQGMWFSFVSGGRNYLRQNDGRPLTPRQRRRLDRKHPPHHEKA